MARRQISGLELSFHPPSKRWYTSWREGGKKRRKYFGPGKSVHDLPSYTEALRRKLEWERERDAQVAADAAEAEAKAQADAEDAAYARMMEPVAERLRQLREGKITEDELGDTPVEQMYRMYGATHPQSEEEARELDARHMREVEVLGLAEAIRRRNVELQEKLGVAGRPRTIRDLSRRWLDSEKAKLAAGQIVSSSYTSKDVHIKTFADFAGMRNFEDERELNQLLLDYRQHLQAKLAGGDYAGNTVNDKIKFTKQLIDFAFAAHYIEHLPRCMPNFVKRFPVNKGGQPYTLAEVHQIWAVAGPRMRCWIALALNCCFKNGDIVELTTAMLQGNRLIGHRHKRRANQAGVPMNYELWPVTRKLLKLTRDDLGKKPKATGGKVFAARSAGKTLKAGTISGAFKRIAIKAGVRDGKFERFRDTSAAIAQAHLLGQGKDLYLLQVMLAHADKSTAAYYTSQDPTQLNTTQLDAVTRYIDRQYGLTHP